MTGAVHSAEPVWANGRPTPAVELRPGDLWRDRMLKDWKTLDLAERAGALADLIQIQRLPPTLRLDRLPDLGRRRPR